MAGRKSGRYWDSDDEKDNEKVCQKAYWDSDDNKEKDKKMDKKRKASALKGFSTDKMTKANFSYKKAVSLIVNSNFRLKFILYYL